MCAKFRKAKVQHRLRGPHRSKFTTAENKCMLESDAGQLAWATLFTTDRKQMLESDGVGTVNLAWATTFTIA